MKLNEMYRMNPGERVEGQAYIVKAVYKAANRGSSYVDVWLSDSTGTYPAKLWGNVDMNRSAAGVLSDSVISFSGMIEVNDGRTRVSVDPENYRIMAEDEIDYATFAYAPEPEQVVEMMNRLNKVVRKIESPFYRNLCKRVIAKYGTELASRPAGTDWHHAYNGGLLRHIVEKAEIALLVVNQNAVSYGPYPTPLNKDMLLAGAILTDLDKMYNIAKFPKVGKMKGSYLKSGLSSAWEEMILPVIKTSRKHRIEQEELNRFRNLFFSGAANASGSEYAFTVEANITKGIDELSVLADHLYSLSYRNSYDKADGFYFSSKLKREVEMISEVRDTAKKIIGEEFLNG